MPNSSPLTSGSTVDKRYRIVRELGKGGFGRTYLAEDLNRFNEYCVLKEFAPQVQGVPALQKAAELFEREAGVLYQLQHPQIPRFRELMRLNLGGTESLFLVQDYVEGHTYCELLRSYQQGGRRFSEAECTTLLLQILPVLEYIHSLGVVHRDISPDNLILRSSDKLPVLIDFGGVKQAATTAVSQVTGKPLLTLLGKEGYAPQEQLQQGKAFPCSDLYSLAVTVLVLLTGKEPKALYDSVKANWRWRQEVSVSASFSGVLDQMLAHRPRDRYQSAKEVLQVLSGSNPTPLPPTVPPPSLVVPPNPSPVATTFLSRMRTINFVGRRPDPNSGQIVQKPNAPVAPSPVNKFFAAILWKLGWITFKSLLVLAVGLGAWTVVRSGWLQFPSISLPLPSVSLESKTEPERLAEITKRRQALRIPEAVLYRQVDRQFYAKYPELKGRALTNKQEDAKWRLRWIEIAEDLLDKLEKERGI